VARSGHVVKMARQADAAGPCRAHPLRVWTEQIKGITVRPLRIDAGQHVLVALVGGVEVGVAHLERDGARAEITVAVADGWRHRGIGTVLADRLAADARAAGIAVADRSTFGVSAVASWARSRCACASATRRRAATAPR
jgi:GNAT superfamily N-acetyltransferase